MTKGMFQFLAVMMILGVCCAPAWADPVTGPVGNRTDRTPEELKGVGVDEHLNTTLPLDLQFVDENARPVRLKEYFKGNRPVIVQMGYLECPRLCGLVSQGLIESLKKLKLEMGKDYEFVFVSINPDETPQLSYLKKKSYIQEYGPRGDASGWHFLTGKAGAIEDLTKAVGWRYKWVNTASQFSHPAVIMICTPDGRLSRYLYGVKFPEQTLRLSLVDASDGKIGTAMDQILLFCCAFDPSTGKYTWAAYGLLRIAGIATMLAIAAAWWRQWRKGRKTAMAGGQQTESDGATEG
jgi:protein SCO1/2